MSNDRVAASSLDRYDALLAKGGGTAAWARCADDLAKTLRAVANMHGPVDDGGGGRICARFCTDHNDELEEWPCPTVVTIMEG